jgi:AraC-like DNA-binding protein
MEAVNQLIKSHGLEANINCLVAELEAKSQGTRFSYIHYHKHIEFLYGISGVARVLLGNRTYDMEKGDLIIINSNEVHDVMCISEACEYYVIQFKPELLYSRDPELSNIRYLLPFWQNDVSFGPALRKAELDPQGISQLAEEIMTEWKTRQLGYMSLIHANILKIFVRILRLRGISCDQPKLPSELYSLVSGALDGASLHLEDWNTQKAARSCNLSYSHFSRSFKQAFGIPFSEYLESLRLIEAERILLTTDKSVTDIAAELGFSSASHFIERFKKNYGLPPKIFRAKIRNSNIL